MQKSFRNVLIFAFPFCFTSMVKHSVLSLRAKLDGFFDIKMKVYRTKSIGNILLHMVHLTLIWSET
jgi:hypothetical protein